VNHRTFTISDAQRLLDRSFGAKDRARGRDGTFLYLIEEVGELAEALREPQQHDLPGEFADCLAWLASLANVAGVDLEAAFAAKYGGGCLRCHATPCACATKP
jgi:NTP pyrophosphatase (non-canonical NTP hydrolase)